MAFDQAFVMTELSHDAFMSQLTDAIQRKKESIERFYLGYFMQFKKTRKIVRRSRHLPKGYSVPYWRAELYVTTLRSTELSQHERLKRLSQIDFASACYVCPMLPKKFDIMQDANPKDLMCVDIRSGPDYIKPWGRHFLTFKSKDDSKPLWTPSNVLGSSCSFEQWASPDSPFGPKKLSPHELKELIKLASNEMDIIQPNPEKKMNLPWSFNVVEFLKK